MAVFMVRSAGNRRLSSERRPLLSGLALLTLISMLAGMAAVAARPAPARAQDAIFETATITPEDALVFVGFTLDTESEQWQRGSELVDRAGFGPSLAELQQELLSDAPGGGIVQEVFLGGEGALVVTGAALEAAAELDLTGTTGFEDVVMGTPAAGDEAPEPTGVAFILQPRSPDTAFVGIQDALAENAQEAGTDVTETEYNGVTIQYAPAGLDGEETDLALARVDDFLLLGGAPADLEPLIDTSTGSIPALADFAPFGEVRGELGEEDFLLYAFINGVAAAGVEAIDQAGLGAFTETAGTNQYNGILIRADDPGFRMETVTMAAEGQTLPPGAAAFDPELLERVPSDVLFFLDAYDLGQTGVVDALGLLVAQTLGGGLGAQATPTAEDQSAEAFIEAQHEAAAGVLGFNLRTDLLQQFVGEYALAIRGDEDPSNLSALLVTGVNDAGTVVQTLEQLSRLVQSFGGGTVNVTTREVDGSQINVIETDDPAMSPVEFGVVGDQFLLGYGPAIDDYVAGPDASLADDEQFQTVTAELPSEGRNGILYVNLSRVIPLIQVLDQAGEGEDALGGIEDAAEECAAFDTQEEAQATLDEDPLENFLLDQDGDGEACEDFFATAEVASPEATPAAAMADYSAIRAFALSAYEVENMRRSSAILYIEE